LPLRISAVPQLDGGGSAQHAAVAAQRHEQLINVNILVGARELQQQPAA
jgi:hypothetical protein